MLALQNALGRVIGDAALKDQLLGRLIPAGLPALYGRGQFRGYASDDELLGQLGQLLMINYSFRIIVTYQIAYRHSKLPPHFPVVQVPRCASLESLSRQL